MHKCRRLPVKTAVSSVYATLLVLIFAIGQMAQAQELSNEPATIAFSTDGEISFDQGTPASRLLQKAEQAGGVELIVGLRFTMIAEHSLESTARRQQAERMRQLENEILNRVFGSVAESKVTRFGFIPYMSIYVNSDQLRQLVADPGVAWIRETQEYKPALSESISTIHSDELLAQVPGATGKGYAIAVIDTGVEKTHPMLAGKIGFGAEACFSCNQAGGCPTNYRPMCPGGVTKSTDIGSGLPCDDLLVCDHGTHVASIAAGRLVESPMVLRGVAPEASIISIMAAHQRRAPDCPGEAPSCTTLADTDIILALRHVYELRNTFKIAAVNLSIAGEIWKGNYCDDAYRDYRDIFSSLTDVGIMPVVAAGNEGDPYYQDIPACISTAFSVGATTKADDQIWPLSNNSLLTLLMAPGEGITGASTNGAYVVKSGTSQATPHVAGAIAILKQAEPSSGRAQIRTALLCTSKSVVRAPFNNFVGTPQRRRLDILAAYTSIKRKPVLRDWQFDKKVDFLDFDSFRGEWSLTSGKLNAVNPQGWVGIYSILTTGTCQQSPASRKLTAIIKRTSSTPNMNNNAGIFINTHFQYGDKKSVTGYFVAYSNTSVAAIYKVTSGSFEGNLDHNSATVCRKDSAPVKVNDYNKIEITVTDTGLTYYLNGVMVCTAPGVQKALGAIMVASWFDPIVGSSLQIDSLKIEPLGGGSGASQPVVMNPTSRGLATSDEGGETPGSLTGRFGVAEP